MTKPQIPPHVPDAPIDPASGTLKIVLIYAIFASLWILLSDKFVAWLFSDIEQITQASMLKGLLFIAITALLLHGLIKSQLKTTLDATTRERQIANEQKIILGTALVGIAKTRNRSFTWVNRAFEEMTGYEASELIGMPTSRLYISQTVYEEIGAKAYPAMLSEGSFRGECQLVRKNGEVIWVEFSSAFLDVQTGDSIGAFFDITERKAAEFDLQEKERRLALVIDGSDQGFWDWQLDSNKFSVSARFETMLGYEPGEMSLSPDQWSRYVHEDDMARVQQSIQNHLAGKSKSHEQEFRSRTKSGEWRWILTRGSIVERDTDGRPLRMAGTHTDVTERKRLEFELSAYGNQLELLVEHRTQELAKAKEVAEAASRAKSTFLANMSHELRTPMNAIIGMTNIVQRNVREIKIAEQLGKIEKAARHLLAVINDVLDISKIEAERLTLEQETFRLAEVLENLSGLVGEKATEKGLQLHLEPAPALAALHLRGDPMRLCQILVNLTGNAVKFTEQGSITLRVIPIEETPSEVSLRFEVQDTGIGISAEDQQRLFTAFEQADGSMTRKYGGTGLGLAISKRLATLMGGNIGVTSMPGAGSTFWLTTRLGKAEKAAMPLANGQDNSAEMQLKKRFSQARILLVEDEPINQEVSCGLLEEVGLQVDLADDGQQAVVQAKDNSYDLILMDIQMPKLNGIDATRAIRALPGWQHTPILAMTANAFDDDRKRCIEAGMNDHIGKPVDPDKLFKTLLKWLEQGKQAN